MEWVETVAKTIAEARELALDRLGVAEDDAEFEVLEEPKAGLFGRVRGEARVRARVKPTSVRPKQERRGRGRKEGGKPDGTSGADSPSRSRSDASPVEREAATISDEATAGQAAPLGSAPRSRHGQRNRPKQPKEQSEMDTDGESSEPVDPAAVGAAAVAFMTDLAAAFGTPATADLAVDGSELDVRLQGDDLGLLIGPGGRTLMAVQDLARVASQRRLGDHETRLRIDVAGYRERRRAALEKFAAAVAQEVLDSGRSKALEPMVSSDRKIVHDSIVGIDGVTSHSDGEEPRRRVVITPA